MNSDHIEKFKELKEDIKEGKVLSVDEAKAEIEKAGGELLPKDWLGLMGYFLSDTSLLARHAELLHSDNESVAVKALEQAYKVRGKYANVAPEAVKVTLDFLPKGGEITIQKED